MNVRQAFYVDPQQNHGRWWVEASIEVWIDELDVRSHARFEEVMRSEGTDDVKIAKLQELTSEIVDEQLSYLQTEASPFGDVTLGKIEPDAQFSLDYQSIVDEWNSDQQAEREFGKPDVEENQ